MTSIFPESIKFVYMYKPLKSRRALSECHFLFMFLCGRGSLLSSCWAECNSTQEMMLTKHM